MTYNIFSPAAPKMPHAGKGTKFIKFILSQASSDMREPLVPMAIPALAAHLCGVTFVYSDNKSYELCGQMGHLIGPSGIGKAQLTHLVEAIMRPFRSHDETEFKKLVDWQRQMKTKSANKEKPERPDVSFLVSACRCHQRRLHPERHGPSSRTHPEVSLLKSSIVQCTCTDVL